jgi:hypothetical protein
MSKIAFFISVFTFLSTIQAQVIKHFTVQILNPAPCTTCCNGTILVQVTNCGAPISCSITLPTSTLPIGGSGLWTNLCDGIYTVGVNVGDTTVCPFVCNISWGYFNPPTGVTDKNIFQFDTIEVFPNPTTEALNIKLQNLDIQSCILARLINSRGEIVKEEKLFFNKEIARLKTDILPYGIYILELTNSGQKCVRQRVLIQ